MWDKSLDEGIFLCDHNSHIITADFLESLSYMRTQLDYGNWTGPNEILVNKIDFISYILLTHSEGVENAIICIDPNIKLSNKRNKEFNGFKHFNRL